MNQRLVRIPSADGILMPGLLSVPDQATDKIIIHIHGINGNFYENLFLDELAITYTNRWYAFLTFNNRGRDFISEFHKGDGSAVIGGSLERFRDCVLDLEGVMSWSEENGYREVVLEGHSYGCNKAVYYYHRTKNPFVKKIVLLGPCDIPELIQRDMGQENYKAAKELTSELIAKGKDREMIDFPVNSCGKAAAGTFYYDFLPNGENDIFRYREGANAGNLVLQDIHIPVLVVFGDKDPYVLSRPANEVKEYLRKKIPQCEVRIISGADHEFYHKEKELGTALGEV